MELEQKQIDLLYQHRNMDDGVLIESEDLESARDLLGAVLEHEFGLQDGRSLPLSSQVSQLRNSLEAGETGPEALNLSRQHPETGGATEAERETASNPFATDNPGLDDALEAADGSTKRAAIEKLAKARSIESRLPKRAETLRKEVADALGYDCEPDALATEALEHGVPSDPREIDSLAL